MFGRLLARTVLCFRPIQATNKRLVHTSQKLLVKLMAETQAKAQRRRFLEDQIIHRGKKVLHAERRKMADTVFGLKQQGKCPAVIRREGFEDIDVVLSGKEMRGFVKNVKSSAAPVHIRFDGEEIECLIHDIKLHSEGFIQKVELRRFILGEPNEIAVSVNYTHLTHNHYFTEMSIPKFYKGLIHLITYNEDYPAQVAIDISFVSPMRPYRFGDLQNLLPPGVEVNLKRHRLSDRLVSLGEPQQTPQEDLQEAQVLARALEPEPGTEEEQAEAEAQQAAKEEKQKKKKEKEKPADKKVAKPAK